MTTNQRRYLFLPSHLSQAQINSVVAGSRIVSKKSKDVQVLLHKIITKMVYSKGEYVQVSKEERKGILKTTPEQWMRRLIDAGIIEVAMIEWVNPKTGEVKLVEAYKQGKTCKQYRIKDFQTYKRIDISDDNYVLSALDQQRGYGIAKNKVYETLANNVDRLYIIDSDEAVAELNAYFDKRNKKKNWQIGISGTEFIEMFNSHVFEVSVDDFGFRFHGVYIRLKSDFRPFYRFIGYENEVLWNVDLVNSQPLLSSLISAELIKELVPECQEAIPIYKWYQEHEDFIKFRRKCIKGELYEYLANQFKKQYRLEITRDQAKKVFYYSNFAQYPDDVETLSISAAMVLNDESGIYTLKGKIKKKTMKILSLYLFHKLFPSVYMINYELKQFNWDHLVPSKECVKTWSNPALLLQRVESGLLLRKVVPELQKRVENFVTIHDSFLVLKRDVGKTKKAIKKVFEDYDLPAPQINAEDVQVAKEKKKKKKDQREAAKVTI